MPKRIFVLLACMGWLTNANAELKTQIAQNLAVPRLYQLDGKVEAVQKSTVSAQTAGRVLSLHFDVDDRVEKEALLVRLDDAEHRAQLASAKARVAAASASRADAIKNHERIKELLGRKLAAQAELDSAKSALDAAIANQEAAQASLEQSQAQLAYTEIRAPYSGLVTQRHVQVGESVQPGTPLFSGISLDELRVSVDVPQSMIPAVRAGNHARILSSDGETWVEPQSITIFPYAETGSNSFQVRLGLGKLEAPLYPGMWVKVAFEVGKAVEMPIPYDALVFRSEVTGVYVVDEHGSVSLRYVRVGQRLAEGMVSIISGLEPGEKIALEPEQATAAMMLQRTGK